MCFFALRFPFPSRLTYFYSRVPPLTAVYSALQVWLFDYFLLRSLPKRMSFKPFHD